MKKFCEKASVNYQIQLRPNKDLENAFRAYETSWETERLKSEQNRKIYCELIDFGGSKGNSEKIRELPEVKPTQNIVNVVADDDSDGEEEQKVEAVVGEKPKWWTKIFVEPNRPKTLADISIEGIAKAFKTGRVDNRISCQNAVNFGEIIDIDLPILDLLELDNETFWKRVVEFKIHDVHKLQKLKRDPKTNWKKIGLELKLTEYIQSLEVEDFEAPATKQHLNDLTDKLVTIVEDLSIQKMKPRRRYDRNPFNPSARIVNFSPNECFHGSLEFLGLFYNLKNLQLKFDPGNLGMKYTRRFFLVSTVDIENVGKALMSLTKMENFEILNSDLSESEKIFHLLMPMRSMEHLKVVNFSFCSINSKESGEHFNKFLFACRSLECLELKGNNLDSEFCFEFAQGIENFHGKLEFLGLSLTPILGNGLCHIVRSISKKDNVKRLDISHCDNPLHCDNDECVKELIALIAQETETLEINMQGNCFIDEETKENFIKALNKNFKIDEVRCEECGFSSNQMMKVMVLLTRNKYYKQNPILRKDHFTVDDEAEIEKFLKRTKHPLLLKYKREFIPVEGRKPFTFKPKSKPKVFKKLALSFGHESTKCRL